MHDWSVRQAWESRREFLGNMMRLGSGIFLPFAASGLPAAPLNLQSVNSVRISGKVHAGGRGIARVAVSDGINVVTTGPDGGYELLSYPGQSFVFISLPSGFRVPVNAAGTARFYQPIPPDAKGNLRADFELRRQETSGGKHRFLVLADPQIQNMQEAQYLLTGTAPDVKQLLTSLPETDTFGVGCGDLIFDDLPLFGEYEKMVTHTGVPFFQVVGNHDLDLKARSDERSDATFRKHFGPTYYSFNRGSVHYVVLDDVFFHGSGFFPYLPYVQETQLRWLEQDLALVEPGSPVVVFLHIPMHASRMARYIGTGEPLEPWFTLTDFANPQPLYSLLKPFKAHLISGHTHENEHVFVNGLHEHILGTVCGAWWTGPICFDGTPNGYAVYEVSGEDIRWQYKSTGQPLTHQVTAEIKRTGNTTTLFANVWDWSPEWKVFYYENDIRKGEMTRSKGFDPQAIQLYGSKTLPAGKTWVEPILTDHLFKATVSAGARVRIEAVDPWGRSYSRSIS